MDTFCLDTFFLLQHYGRRDALARIHPAQTGTVAWQFSLAAEQPAMARFSSMFRLANNSGPAAYPLHTAVCSPEEREFVNGPAFVMVSLGLLG